MDSKKKQKWRSISLIAISLLTFGDRLCFSAMGLPEFIRPPVRLQNNLWTHRLICLQQGRSTDLNDALCLLLIYSLFREKKYLRIAFLVLCFEFLVMLPLYLIVKLNLEGPSEISSPLLSQIHRLIVNPMLMLILIVGFYYQSFGL